MIPEAISTAPLQTAKPPERLIKAYLKVSDGLIPQITLSVIMVLLILFVAGNQGLELRIIYNCYLIELFMSFARCGCI